MDKFLTILMWFRRHCPIYYAFVQVYLKIPSNVDQMKGRPSKPSDLECTNTLLNCILYSIVWNKYYGPGVPKPTYVNLKAELFQSEKYLTVLFVANLVTSTSVSTSNSYEKHSRYSQHKSWPYSGQAPSVLYVWGYEKFSSQRLPQLRYRFLKVVATSVIDLLFCRKVMSLTKFGKPSSKNVRVRTKTKTKRNVRLKSLLQMKIIKIQ